MKLLKQKKKSILGQEGLTGTTEQKATRTSPQRKVHKSLKRKGQPQSPSKFYELKKLTEEGTRNGRPPQEKRRKDSHLIIFKRNGANERWRRESSGLEGKGSDKTYLHGGRQKISSGTKKDVLAERRGKEALNQSTG